LKDRLYVRIDAVDGQWRVVLEVQKPGDEEGKVRVHTFVSKNAYLERGTAGTNCFRS